MIDTASKARFIRQFFNKVILLGDSDFSRNAYFLKFFSGMRFEVLPFNPQQRFVSNEKFVRDAQVLVGGTTHNLCDERPSYLYSDFIEYFRSNTYHFLRSQIVKLEDPRILKLTSTFEAQKGIGHSKYYSVDLPSLMRSVRFVAYGDELSGAPAISNLEGIACGCIAFMSEEAVKGLPLVKGIHYCPLPLDLNVFLQVLDDLDSIDYEIGFVERGQFHDVFYRFVTSQCGKFFGSNV